MDPFRLSADPLFDFSELLIGEVLAIDGVTEDTGEVLAEAVGFVGVVRLLPFLDPFILVGDRGFLTGLKIQLI